MEQVIIERGGRVIDDTVKCMYLLQEDGHSSGWDQEEDGPNLIHFRYIQECIVTQGFLNVGDAQHLVPQSHVVPIKEFSKACVELCLVKTELELLVFGKLIELYGF